MTHSPRLISVLDTSICNANLGNQIIMQAIYTELENIFPFDFLMRLQYGERVGGVSLAYLKDSIYSFFGGTNSLSSQMNKYSQMGLRLRNTLSYSNLTLFGLGWWQYQVQPNTYTKAFLRRLLSSNTIHSVRDQYTYNMLQAIGIKNVLNTSCPSTWNLSSSHCESIPQMKADFVVSTITDYNQSNQADLRMLRLLLKSYKKVYLWLQGLGDYQYLVDLGIASNNKLVIIPPNLSSYEKILQTVDLDYIGTRLHAGIKAIQMKRRSLILSVDNRATEISSDIGLPVVDRTDYFAIEQFIESRRVTAIHLPITSINRWRQQFEPLMKCESKVPTLD